MKGVILKVSELRDAIVYDEKYVANEEVNKSLFDKLGGIDGMKAIVNSLFD